MDQVRFRTPENIEFSYELGGLGSRFVATLIDITIQFAALGAIGLFIGLVHFGLGVNVVKELGSFFGVARTAMIVALFTLLGGVFLGYHIFFESLRNGQTPGKKVANLQVIKENGTSINFFDAALRNIFRLIDFLPFLYALGIVMILATRKRKRIGDLVAGTLVVRIAGERDPAVLPTMEADKTGDQIDVKRLDDEEYNLIRNFLMRRNNLDLKVRRELAQKIVKTVQEKTGPVDGASNDQEELLERIASEYRKVKRFL